MQSIVRKAVRPFTVALKGIILTLIICATGGAWAAETDNLQRTNPVTGETENYTWKFVGTDTWNGTGYWQNSSGANPSGVPAKSGEGTWDPILFDGNTINITASMSVEGWELRMGLYNGANVRMNTFVKWQSDNTPMWVTVDDTSKLTVGGFGKGNLSNEQVIKCSTTRENGIEWLVNLESTGTANNTFEYYLKGAGSVSYQAVSAANHKIRMADVSLSGEKTVKSKTLVSFTSTDKTFTADAAIKLKSGDTVLKTVYLSSVTSGAKTLTTDNDVGTCELVQTSTGIVLYWVDGDPNDVDTGAKTYKPSININFTHSGNGLSTGADVGLTDYEVPGTSWNNFAGANGTYSTVKAVDATGEASTASGVSVEVSGARGSYQCSSLTASSNPLHGYIDENGNNTTPTITVSGIPYDKYRVVVYSATDTAGVKFGYITINGSDYTYSNGNVTGGTAAWGASGAANSAESIAEGVNVLVSPVTLGSTLTVVGHRSGSNRGCIAAIQIVEYVPEVTENDLVISVSGPTEYPVDAAKTLSGTVYLTGSGTLTLSGSAKITAATIDVGEDVILNVNAARLDATTFTGAGTVVYTSSAPVSGKGWTSSATWTGILWIKNHAIAGLNPDQFANARSTLRLSGCTGYFNDNNNTKTCEGTLDLDNDTYSVAFSVDNGWSTSGKTIFAKLTGSGTLGVQTRDIGQRYIFKDVSGFTGAINLAGRPLRVIIGDGASITDPAEGTITVLSGVTATVASGKTWTANKNGFVVNGTLNVEGALSSSQTTSAIRGSGTVVFNGKAPSPTGTAWWQNGAWKGTVEVKNHNFGDSIKLADYGNLESYVCMDGSQAPLSLEDGAHNIKELKIGSGGFTQVGAYGYNATKNFVIPAKLTGSGTYTVYMTDNATKTTYFTGDVSEFSGTIAFDANAESSRVVIGESTDRTFKNQSLIVASGCSLTVRKQWGINGFAGGIFVDENGLLEVASSGFLPSKGGFTVDGTLRTAGLNYNSWGHIAEKALATVASVLVNDTGVLELTSSGNTNDATTGSNPAATSVDMSKVTGTGTIKYISTSGWRAFTDNDEYMPATTLTIQVELADSLIITKCDNGETVIGNLAGTKNIRSDWTPAGVDSRTLTVTQSKDTEWQGKFVSNRITNFKVVAPAAGTPGTLTLSGTHDIQIPMQVDGSVNLTGTWKGNTTVAGTFACSGTLTGNLTTQSGSTLDFSNAASGERIAGTLTLNSNTTVKFPSAAAFPFRVATSLASAVVLDASKFTIGGVPGAEGTTLTIGTNGYAYAPTSATIGANAVWSEITWESNYAAGADVSNAECALNVTESCTLALGSASAAKVTFNVEKDKILTLTGSITAGEICIKGEGTVLCSAADTLIGVLTGDGTVKYPEHTLPSPNTVFKYEGWRGTLILPYCGRLNNVAYDGTVAQTNVRFDNYGNANSKIKAPGFKGDAAVDRASVKVCQAELVIDEGDENAVEFNHGTTSLITGEEDVGFIFRKLSGSGKLKLDGTSDTVQYVFRNVSGFAGSVEITDPTPDDFKGGKKSFIFGADDQWKIANSTYPAYLVINTSMTVATGKHWDVPAGIVLMDGVTLTLADNAQVSRIRTQSDLGATLAVAANATATVDVANDGIMPAKIDIASSAKLELSNTTITKLTIPANVSVTYTNAGTLDLSKCSALKELHLDLGVSNGNTIDLTKITLPETCDTIYYDIGETVRNLSGYTVPSVGAGKSFYYYATETIAEYGADGREGLGYFTIQNVPAGASVKLLRRSGAEVDAAPTSSGSSTHAYAGGSQFAGNACWHEWDFESETLADTGMYIDDANNRVALQAAAAAYKQVTVNTKPNSETKKAISSASKPYPASTTTFANNWSAAVRCSMPSTAGQVAVAFGDATSGIIGLASGAQGFVDLFTWTSGTYTSLAQFKVESPSNDNNMHIYVFAVQYDAEKSKRYLSFYRDGEFIHKAEIGVSGITTFKVGDIAGERPSSGDPLPAAATSGYTDYVRLYNKVLDQSLVEALAARRPFASSKDTYVREVSVEGTWIEANTWTKKGVDTTYDRPADAQYVTVSVAQPASITVNLAADSNYETLIFKGQGTISLLRGESSTGNVKAGMVVVRSGTVLRAAYNAVDFANVPVGVDENAALQFDFSNYPFESVTASTSFFVTGPVVAAEYDETVEDRISVVGGREHTWTLSGDIVRDGVSGALRYQVTIAPDHVPGGPVYYKEGTLAAGMTVYNDAGLNNPTTLFAGDNVIVSAASSTGDVTVDDTFNGVLTVQRTTVNLTSTGSAALAGKTVTVAENCTLNFAGGEFGAMTLAGAGSFAVTDDTAVTSLTGPVGINVPSSVTLTLGAVTPFVTGGVTGYGTVKLPEHSGSEGFDFSRYGSGGTIALTSFTDYIDTSKANVTSALRLDGNMTITAMSTTTYTFAKITGTGNLTFPSGNSPTITIANLEDYAGTIINNSSSVTVTKLTKTGVYGTGDVLLTKGGTGDVNVSAVEIGGVAKYGYWVGNNYYIAAAGYGGQRYGTVTEAIDAALAAGGDVSSIEVLDGSTSLPAGYAQYYIENGHVGKYDAAVICNTAEVYYYKTSQDAVDAVSLNYTIAGKYSYFEIYSANDVAIAVPASPVWDALTIKIKRMNGIQVSVSAASADEVYAPNGEVDENGAVAYAKTTLATDYYWAGATTSEETDYKRAWARADNWRIGSSVGPKGSRSPSSIDTANIPEGAYVSEISVADSLTITGGGTITAANGISLTAAGATISVTGVTLSPAPTTTVENAMVDSVTEDGVTTYTVVTAAAEVNGTRYKTFAEALSAINAATGVVTVELLRDATLDLSRNGNVLGGSGATKITINGNGNTLTFNQTEAWAQVNTANGAELELNNVNLTNSIGFSPAGNALYVYNHDISFNCVATLNNVTSDKALAFWKNVTLNEVSVAETEDAYSIWIHTTASSVTITDLVVNTAAGRGIKVDDYFVNQIGGTPSATELTIDGATFTTKNSKSAVLVSSSYAISVEATGTIDITGVPADPTNLVWVDEASSANFGLVTVTGATIGVEKPDSYEATISTAGTIDGYYKTLNDAIADAGAAQVITLLKNATGSIASGAITIDVDKVEQFSCSITLSRDATLTVVNGTATVSPEAEDGSKVISTTSGSTTIYKVVYGTIFSVW